MLVVVFRSLRCCLSFELRRPVFVLLVFLRFHLCLLLVVLLYRLLPRLSRGPLCRHCRRFCPLLQVRVSFSTSSLRVRFSTSSLRVRVSRLVVRVAVVLFVTALTATGMATLGPPVIHGTPVYVSSTRLVGSRLLPGLQQLLSLIRTLSGVFAVSLLLQALLRRALLVL